jgi:hypothetical protein
MKSKWYIFVLAMLVITAFNYNETNSFSEPSIKVSKVKLENDNVLCLQISIASNDYIDSLIVGLENFTDNSNTRIFVFNPNTKRASVNYYFYGDNFEKDFDISLKFKSSNNEFERTFNLKEI